MLSHACLREIVDLAGPFSSLLVCHACFRETINLVDHASSPVSSNMHLEFGWHEIGVGIWCGVSWIIYHLAIRFWGFTFRNNRTVRDYDIKMYHVMSVKQSLREDLAEHSYQFSCWALVWSCTSFVNVPLQFEPVELHVVGALGQQDVPEPAKAITEDSVARGPQSNVLNICTQQNAGTASVPECVLKTLACWVSCVGPSKQGSFHNKGPRYRK